MGVTVAPSTVWQILPEAGINPSPDRAATTWASFQRAQASALLAADFIETLTLTGTRMHILAVIEHATRRIRILGATALRVRRTSRERYHEHQPHRQGRQPPSQPLPTREPAMTMD